MSKFFESLKVCSIWITLSVGLYIISLTIFSFYLFFSSISFGVMYILLLWSLIVSKGSFYTSLLLSPCCRNSTTEVESETSQLRLRISKIFIRSTYFLFISEIVYLLLTSIKQLSPVRVFYLLLFSMSQEVQLSFTMVYNWTLNSLLLCLCLYYY